MNLDAKYNNIFVITILFLLSLSMCKKTDFKTIGNILEEYQWRKTLETVYNDNNELEEYKFNFDTAPDCEKNTFIIFGGIQNDEGNGTTYNFCNDFGYSFSWKILNDSLYIIPYDTTLVKINKIIDHYNNKSFVLRYDTMIENKRKIIKETYSAFDKM